MTIGVDPARVPSATAAQATSAEPGPGHAKLVHAAQQFEAIMLSELMKPLAKSSAIGESEEEQGQSGTLQAFGVEAMAGSLARSGALGFAGRIVDSLDVRSSGATASKATNSPSAGQSSADKQKGGVNS